MKKPSIYCNPISNHSNLITNFLTAIGKLEDVELKIVDLAKGEQKQPKVLQANPSGQIPAVDDNGIYAYESSSVLRYLALKYNSPMYPTDNLGMLAQIDSAYEHIRQKPWDFVTRFVFHSFFMQKFFGKEGNKEVIEKAKAEISQALSHLDQSYFKDSDWVVGSQISLADMALGTMLMHLKLTGYSEFPAKTEAFINIWETQPWFKSTPYYLHFRDS